jgi:hypothetical protein
MNMKFMKLRTHGERMEKFAIKIVFFFSLTLIFLQKSFASDANLATGAQSFDAFVSAGTQTSLARDAGGIFVNPAAISKPHGYFLSHSLAGYSDVSFRGFHMQNSWSALGFVWNPTVFDGRLLIAGGYYNPTNSEVNQNLDSASFGGLGSSWWHGYARGGTFSRRGGVSASYEVSRVLQWGITLGVTDVEQDSVFEIGSNNIFAMDAYRIETNSFTTARITAKRTTLDGIVGVRAQIMDDMSVGFSAESPLNVIQNEQKYESTGLAVTKTESGSNSPETAVTRPQWGSEEKSLSLVRFPVLYRAGIAWQGEDLFWGIDLNHSTAYRSLEDEKYRSLTGWSLTCRYALRQAVAIQGGMRTDYDNVPAAESLQGAGQLDVRLGLVVKVGNTRFGVGGSYGRLANKNVLDLSLPERGRVVQALVGMTSTFQ